MVAGTVWQQEEDFAIQNEMLLILILVRRLALKIEYVKVVDKCLNLLYTYLLTNCFFIAEYGEGLAGSLNEGVEVATFELVLYSEDSFTLTSED